MFCDFQVVHSERNKEDVEPAGAISKHVSPKSHRLKPESANTRQQGTDVEDEDRSLTRSHLRSLVKEQSENELKNKFQKTFAIEGDELLRKMAQKKETDDVRAGRNGLQNNFPFCIKFHIYNFWNKLQCSTE